MNTPISERVAVNIALSNQRIEIANQFWEKVWIAIISCWVSVSVTFVILKIGSVLPWTWTIVTLPLWGGFCLLIAIGLLMLMGA